LPDTDKDSPGFVSKAHETAMRKIRPVRDVVEGTDRMRRAARLYLPQHPGEDENTYNRRIVRGRLFNATKRTLKGLVGLIYRKQPTIPDSFPPEITTHLENIDNAGSDLVMFARDFTEEAFQDGLAHALVTFPMVNPDTILTLADERNAGLRPYWTCVKHADITNYRFVRRAGRDVLTLVAIQEDTSLPDGLFGEKFVSRRRILTLDKAGAAWELFEQDNTKGDDWLSIANGRYLKAGGQPFDQIPLVTAHLDRTGFMVGDPPLYDLAEENLEHWRVRSGHTNALHWASTPIPIFKGRNGDDELVLASDKGIDLPADGDAYWMEAQGKSLSESRDEQKDIEARMAALGLQMLVRETRGAETAQAKMLDKSEADSALVTASRAIEKALNQMVQVHAEWLGVTVAEDTRIELNKDFSGVMLDPAMAAQLLASLEAGHISRDTYWDALERGEVVKIPDRDLEIGKIEDESTASLERAVAAVVPEVEPADAA